MSSNSQALRLILVVLIVSGTGISASAGPPSQALDAYVKAYTQMGNQAAFVLSEENIRANAGTNMFNSWVDAQCKIPAAKSACSTAVANVNSTNAKTLVTLQQVRSAALDNNLKAAKTFYEKRKLHAEHKSQNTRKRPTQKDVTRYSQASAPVRPASYELEPARGTIYWPDVLLEEEFADCRIRLDGLFGQRKVGASVSGSNVSRQVLTATTQMREKLRSKIRQMTPVEYMAARKFLESLAHEVRFPARIEGVASR